MKFRTFKVILLAIVFVVIDSHATNNKSNTGNFNIKKDLLLVNLDCKTDVDDLQTVAGFVTLLSHKPYSKINFHAVAGTYGIQDGLYVPPNPLFQLAFGTNWTDAHENMDVAVEKVKKRVKKILQKKGHVWIAEAGQSDFSAKLIRAIQAELPKIPTKEFFHVVQHADWNEKVTAPENLNFVKKNADYQKIPDGNGVGNGTPGFRTPEFTQWKSKLSDPHLIAVWQLAVDISNKYNGKDGRYLNHAILAGGLNFSDLAEVCWILGLQDIKDTEEFFIRFAK